jgi:hypothetical protein
VGWGRAGVGQGWGRGRAGIGQGRGRARQGWGRLGAVVRAGGLGGWEGDRGSWFLRAGPMYATP